MNAFDAIEDLNWKKREKDNLDGWLEELDVHKTPVNGIYWRRLKKIIQDFSSEMEIENNQLEEKIKKAIGGIEV